MKIRSTAIVLGLVGIMSMTAPEAARADEGMWLFNDLPKQQLEAKYGFNPTDAWAQHVMRSSVRFNSGGSGSFISSRGLVLTNHHIGADTLYKISTPEHNYNRDGFYAKTLAEERQAPDLELNQLVSIENVTEQVEAAVKAGLSPTEAFEARRAIMAEIEKASLDKTGLRSDVVTLYGGARYHLYRYKRYTDVRLVWAPELAIAFFGGDADNFEYPRYCLDACLFRVYENGKPAKIDDFLRYSEAGPKRDELVFVSGNPGRTSRIYTVAALKFLRDKRFPFRLGSLRQQEIMLQQYGQESQEQERRARDDLFGVQNSRKAYTGMLLGLQDPALMAQKEAAEQTFKKQLANDARLSSYQDAWTKIAALQAQRAELLDQRIPLNNHLFDLALTLVRMAAEDQKPSPQRLREYRESARESLTQQLFSTAPIYDDLEIAKLGDGLSELAVRRGGDAPLVREALAGKGPDIRAAELVGGTRLADVAVRRELAAGGLKAIERSDDAMIRFARAIDPEARRVRTKLDEIAEQERQAYARITEARFAIEGDKTYPDATFTPRLAFGTVRGYEEHGHKVPAWTTFAGAYEHEAAHDAQPPWRLPPLWHKRKDKLDLSTPFNFVCTADIIGGNSGSPVLNRDAELVGLIFDSNIYGLTADYVYTDHLSRAVSVHSSAIREALGQTLSSAADRG